ncbi:NAD(P)-binding protein [Auricularia subglabra TFB-10046 SS5]|nr:NAD(P)-binding protein [Auricularia subglabra TFB-10046 SS5]
MGFPSDVYEQLCQKPVVPDHDFPGKTIIVTGSNVGLGKESVKHFLRLNAEHVIMAVRSPSKGEAARAEILSDKALVSHRANLDAAVSVWELDLSSYASVRAFAQRAASNLERLDVAVLNAGIAVPEFTMLEQDETTITVNVVSTILLAVLLLPTMRRTTAAYNTVPVISVVGSGMHQYTSFPERKAAHVFDELNNRERARMLDRYSVSKLIQLFAVRELAALTRDSQPFVAVNALNPGLCYSDLDRNAKGFQAFQITTLRALMAWTAEEGSRTLVHAAAAGRESHGGYMSAAKLKPEAVAPFVTTQEGAEVQKRLWAELAAKLEKFQPGITSTI